MTSDTMTRMVSSNLNDDIAALRREITQARRRQARGRNAEALADVNSQVPEGQAPSVAANLDAFESLRGPAQSQDELRAELVRIARTLGTSDPDFVAKVAEAVSSVEGKSFRKNLVVSIVLSTIFLIAGWLLSIVATPATMGALLHH